MSCHVMSCLIARMNAGKILVRRQLQNRLKMR